MTTIVHDLRETFTPREKEIHMLMCENLTNKQISARLEMPFQTVQWHVCNITRKLGVRAIDKSDAAAARRRVIFYSGTRIEQVVNYADKSLRAFTLKDIQDAAKKTGFSMGQIKDLFSFLEME